MSGNQALFFLLLHTDVQKNSMSFADTAKLRLSTVRPVQCSYAIDNKISFI